MKYVLIIFLVLASFELTAQSKIDVAKGYTTFLIFDSKIIDIKPGNELEYIIKKETNGPTAEKSLTIKILPEAFPESGTGTNLIVFTEDNYMYNFDIAYKNKLSSSPIHYIKTDNAHSQLPGSIKKESSENQSSPGNTLNSQESNINNVSYEKDEKLQSVIELCKKNQKRRKRIFKNLTKSYNVRLSLRDVAYNDDEIYMFFDFAGYSKVAQGLGSFYGIPTPQNFSNPFIIYYNKRRNDSFFN